MAEVLLEFNVAEKYINALSVLLSFATRNTVRWTCCEMYNDLGGLCMVVYRNVYLTAYNKRSFIIDEQIGRFITLSLAKYFDSNAALELDRVIGLIVEAEGNRWFDIKYVLKYFALERIHGRYKKLVRDSGATIDHIKTREEFCTHLGVHSWDDDLIEYRVEIVHPTDSAISKDFETVIGKYRQLSKTLDHCIIKLLECDEDVCGDFFTSDRLGFY